MLSDSSKAPWSIFAGIVLIVIGFAVIPIILSLVLEIALALTGSSVARQFLYDSPVGNFISVLLQYSASVGVIAWFIYRRHRSILPSLGLRWIQWKDIGYALMGAIGYVVLFTIFMMIVSAIVPLDTTKEQALGFERNVAGLGFFMAFLSLVILPPIAEEIIFRGFLYGTFRSRNIGIVISVISTSLLFGALHLFGASDGSLLWIAFFDTFVLAIVLGMLREKTGAIWAPIFLHALKNGAVFINIFILGSR